MINKYVKRRGLIDRFTDISFLVYFCSIFAHLTYGQIKVNKYIVYTGIILVIISMSFKILYDLLHKKLKITLNLYLIFYSIFVLLSIMSYKWALNIKYVEDILKPLFINIFSGIYIIFYIKSIEDLHRIFNIIILSSIYLCSIVLIKSDIKFGSGIGASMGLNNNYIALVLVLSIIICTYMYFQFKKNIYNVAAVYFFIIIIIANSRKSIIGAFIGYSLFTVLKDKGLKTIKNILLVIFSIIIIFLTIHNNDFLYELIGKRFDILIQNIIGNKNSVDGSILERNFYRETAWSLFKEKSVLGWGIHNFAAYMEYISYSHIAYCHNNYLELLADLGICGFLTYYYIYFYIIYNSIKSGLKKDKIYILSFTLIVTLMIMEYGAVTYYFPAYQIVIMCIYMIIKINKTDIIKKK